MTVLTTPETVQETPRWAGLMEHFYARAGMPMVKIESLHGEAIPQPYRGLLVHSSDMTPTLEQFHGQRLDLTLLNREIQDTEYLREITLNLRDRSRAVEYGVIRIYLNRFSPKTKELILGERKPLGNILHSEAIAHLGWPQAFFRVQSDAHMQAVLHLKRPSPLYGRRNLLLDGSRHILAEVIEVLAPVDN
jgi:hypothetical protein